MILHKYQALGNDFLILDCINFPQNASFLQDDGFLDFVKRVSDRRRLGCDQFIVMEKSQKADAKIVFYNSDGSKAEACGNGTVSSGVYASKFLGKNDLVLETDTGLANVEVDGDKATIELGMPKEVALNEREKRDVLRHVKNNWCDSVMSVNVGNPHCVLMFSHRLYDLDNWQEVGQEIENMLSIFPHKTNVEFVGERVGRNKFTVFVWERGAGRTFACGTGACAVAFAMIKQGLADAKKPIQIYMEGSEAYGNGKPIIIKFGESSVFLTNHAFFEGKIEI